MQFIKSLVKIIKNTYQNIFGYTSEVISIHAQDLKFGDIILTHNSFISSPLCWTIQTFLNEPFSHAALYIEGGKILQAVLSGVEYNTLNSLKSSQVCVMRLKEGLDIHKSFILLQEISKIADKGYDKTAIFYMFWLTLLTKLKIVRKEVRNIADPWDNPDKYFCTQMIAYLYRYENLISVDYTNAICSDFYTSDKLVEVYNDMKG